MVQGNHGGFIGIENRGRVVVQGDLAMIVRPQNSCGPGGFYKIDVSNTQLVNHEGSTIEGSGTLAHINKTEQKEMEALRVLNFGIISPGGEQPGKLVFADANVRFGSVPEKGAADTKMRAGLLRILIAGAANHSALEVTGAEKSKTFTLVEGAANTLDIVTKSGLKPRGTFRIVTAGEVKGTFANLRYNGADQVPYTVNYLAHGIEVVFP
jgi:hypothetical protein